MSPLEDAIRNRAIEDRREALDDAARVRRAVQPILDRCLDFFDEDDLEPESSFAMPVTLKARDVYALREAMK